MQTRILFGPGTVAKAGEVVKREGCTRVLITTDKGVQEAGILNEVVLALEKEGVDYVVFDGVKENPSVAVVAEALNMVVENKCDLIMGVGGGSSMDTAKLCAIAARNPDPIVTYEGMDKFPNRPLPVIAIPTTAGTGSEVSQSAIVTDEEKRRKISIRGTKNAPVVAILDPVLLRSIPPKVAAATGMDALAHAIEAYQSTAASPLSDIFALEAIRLISGNLRQFVSNPENTTAASSMLFGSMLAGAAFANGRVGVPHAMALPLGALFGVPHGVACAVLLLPGMKFSWVGNPTRFATIARTMGEGVDDLPVDMAAQKSIDAVGKLMKDIGIPFDLKAWNIPASTIEPMAQDVIKSKIHITNCRKVTVEDVVRLYNEVI